MPVILTLACEDFRQALQKDQQINGVDWACVYEHADVGELQGALANPWNAGSAHIAYMQDLNLSDSNDYEAIGEFFVQWNLSVTTTSLIKFITCDLFSNVF